MPLLQYRQNFLRVEAGKLTYGPLSAPIGAILLPEAEPTICSLDLKFEKEPDYGPELAKFVKCFKPSDYVTVTLTFQVPRPNLLAYQITE